MSAAASALPAAADIPAAASAAAPAPFASAPPAAPRFFIQEGSFSPRLDGKGKVEIQVGCGGEYKWECLPGLYRMELFGGAYPLPWQFQQMAESLGIKDYTVENATHDANMIANESTERKMRWFAMKDAEDARARADARACTADCLQATAAARAKAKKLDEELNKELAKEYSECSCGAMCHRCCPDA